MTETGSVAGSGGGGGSVATVVVVVRLALLPAALPTGAPAMLGVPAPAVAVTPDDAAGVFVACTGATCASVGSCGFVFWLFGSTPAEVRPAPAHSGLDARQPIAIGRIRRFMSSVPIAGRSTW
jgi:hypothetical protein